MSGKLTRHLYPFILTTQVTIKLSDLHFLFVTLITFLYKFAFLFLQYQTLCDTKNDRTKISTHVQNLKANIIHIK